MGISFIPDDPKPFTRDRVMATAKLQLGDRVIYESIDGKMVCVGSPTSALWREKQNFVIVCGHGDWSGFRTLQGCIDQIPELEKQLTFGNRVYAIVER